MEFKEFLRICRTVFMSDKKVSEFMMLFFYELSSDAEKNDENDSCPFQKETNSRKASKVYYGERPMTRADASYMKTHFNEDALIGKVNELDDYIQQNLVDELTSHGIDVDLWKLPETMCNLFRGYMEEMSREKKNSKTEIILQTSNDLLEVNVIEERKAVGSEHAVDSKIIEAARNFCIDYEDQIEYLVLCQIAEYVAPFHNHVRCMYTEYIRQNDEVKKAIMELNHIPILFFEPNWEYTYLDKFRKDIKKLQLVTEKDLLYEGGKYFHRARQYAEVLITKPNSRIFPCVPTSAVISKQPYRSDLLTYIDEYLYYKDDEKLFNYVCVPPFKWVMDSFDLVNCPEVELTYWMCMFICSACHIIPREIPERHRPDESWDDEYIVTPNLDDITRMEDLYYLTLYVLHDLYCGDCSE